MCNPRRRFLADAALAGLALSPLATLLAACGRAEPADGPVAIRWDRDSCTRCGMVISDRRFAAQLRGGPKDAAVKFDDIGCAVTWLNAQAWGGDAATRIWVADSADAGAPRWLDARAARYANGKTSPMAYNFAAVAATAAGDLDFAAMRQFALNRQG